MARRTVVEFPVDEESAFWQTVEGWSGEHGFRLKQQDESGRLYQKGAGFLVAPMMLSAGCSRGQARMEAWVRANTFVRLFALFLIPSEMGIESGGFKLAAPRKIARNAVNQLLERLGQPPIG